jgi:hypothetical protein
MWKLLKQAPDMLGDKENGLGHASNFQIAPIVAETEYF